MAIGLALALGAACGDDDDAGPQTDEPAGRTAETGADDAGSGEAADGGDGFDCPLSAEEVGEVLGTSVDKDDSTCTYAPAEGLPAVGFIAQLPELCDQGFPESTGYTEPVDGLGVDALLKTGGAATAELWVCAPDAFLVYVDTGDDNTAAAITYAKDLASAALDAG